MLFCLPSYNIPAFFFLGSQLNMKKLRNQTKSSKLRIILTSDELLFCLTSKKDRKQVYDIESQDILPWYHYGVVQTTAAQQANTDVFLIKRKNCMSTKNAPPKQKKTPTPKGCHSYI